MLRIAIAALLVVAGLIHVLPLSGVLGARRLAALYGLSLDDANVVLLLRHRAVLFGLLGSLLLYAAWDPAYQPAAIGVGLVSAVSFLVLARARGRGDATSDAAIQRVVRVDIVAVVALALAAALVLYRGA